jgi:hypothetical protein
MDHFDELCVWVFAGVGGIETIDISEEKEKVRVNHGRRDGAQGIVVAKFDFLCAELSNIACNV